MQTDSLEFQKLDILTKLDAIEGRLKEQDPMLEIHLKSIHSTLLQFEELVHVLPDDKIRIFMAGMAKYKQIKIVEEASKSRTKRGGQSADDF